MHIVVTGGNGMVGNCIKDIVYLYPNHQFTFTNRNHMELTNYLSVLQYFESNKFDYIIHLAADVGGLYKNLNQNYEMLENNLLINLNILNACKKYNINRGVFILSSCIYPNNPKQFPMEESIIHNGPPHFSNEGYAYAKRILEIQCRLINKSNKTEYFCLTPVNLYGPYDNFNVDNGHFISSILHRFYLSKLVGKSCVAYGTGKPLRQFLYAPDFAKIICNILFYLPYDECNQNIIICDDNEYTIKNVIDKIKSLMKIEKINWDSTASDGCMKKTVSNKKFKNLTRKYEKIWDWNWKPLDDGLKESHNWLINNYKIARK